MMFSTITVSSIIVDDEDYERARSINWCLSGKNKKQLKGSFEGGIVNLSNFIIKDFTAMYDHKDRNFLNNCKDNLRKCNHAQNQANKNKRKDGKASQYKGVFWINSLRKWRVKIQKNGIYYHIGLFIDEVEAAKAYNQKALELFGEFAFQNGPFNLNEGERVKSCRS